MKTIFTYMFLVSAFLMPMKAFSWNFQDLGTAENAKHIFNRVVEVAVEAAPYAFTPAKILVAGATVVAALKLGGPLLSVSLFAGLKLLGVPADSALMFAGYLGNFVDTNTVVKSVVPKLPSLASKAVPYLNSWFGSSLTQNMTMVVQEIPKILETVQTLRRMAL